MTIDGIVVAIVVAAVGALLQIGGFLGIVAFLRAKVGSLDTSLLLLNTKIDAITPALAALQVNREHHGERLMALERKVASISDRLAHHEGAANEDRPGTQP